MNGRRTIRIGSGAGFQGDRLEPAVILAAQGALDWLALECLAERTIALAQMRRLADPRAGFDPLLGRRMTALLPVARRNGVRIITNMGAADPLGAGRELIAIARSLGLALRVAVVTGDDVLASIGPDTPTLESGRPVGAYAPLVSANAYLGAEAILPAIATGADVVISGRVADPSLFLAPMIAAFGWALDDWTRLARGTVVGHLLECAGQLTGGYFADPGFKDVPEIAHLGFPYCDVDAEGNGVLGKVAGTGGLITLATATEQLLYEVTDPSAYLTPDVVADFTTVRLADAGRDRVAVADGTGRARPAALKVSVGYRAGFLGEGEISYAGPNALARARLASEIVRERLQGDVAELRMDFIGIDSAHRTSFGHAPEPYEVRLRVAGRAPTREAAERIGMEVEALFTNGPAGGGGARKLLVEQVGVVSTLLGRSRVRPAVTVLDTSDATQAA